LIFSLHPVWAGPAPCIPLRRDSWLLWTISTCFREEEEEEEEEEENEGENDAQTDKEEELS